MPVGPFCLVFIAFALPAPAGAQAMFGDGAPPVARLQRIDDLFAPPPGPVSRQDRPSQPIRFFSTVIGFGAALIAEDRLFTEAEMNGGSASGPRFDLSIGLNF